jgi:hypothetical protein
MFKIFNESYYIDVDVLEDYVNLPSASGEPHVHVVKYEIIKTMIDTVLTESSDIDENLGLKTSELSLPFKFAFNTLLTKKIINKF